jgi:hypothetical protein
LTRRLFTASAIALALALFGVMGLAPSVVRERVSPWAVVGATAAAGWCTLPRWTKAVREGRLFRGVRRAPDDWTPRQVAARAAMTLSTAGPWADMDVARAAFLGALAV